MKIEMDMLKEENIKLRNEIQLRERLNIKNRDMLLNALKKKFGDEVIKEVVNFIGEQIYTQWNDIAQKQSGKTSIKDLVDTLWEPAKQRGFEFSREEKDGGIQIYCTRCPIFDFAKEMGNTDWMYHFECAGDEYIVKGFNPNIGLKRTKTLMQGNECCNHFYFFIK